MPTLTENLATRYATAVYQILAEEFPRLKARTLELHVVEQVGLNAELPLRWFELIVDEPTVANWRLVPDHLSEDRWRVQIACRKPRPSHANAAREQRINEALRAIPHPYLTAEEV